MLQGCFRIPFSKQREYDRRENQASYSAGPDLMAMQPQMGQRTTYGERFRNISSEIGPGCKFGDDVFLGLGSIIGQGTWIGNRSKVWHFNNLIGYNRIGEDCMIASYVQLDPRAEIGDRTRVQNYTAIASDCKVGSNCFISLGVIFTNSKYPPSERLEPIVIGDGVIIGAHVTLLPGVRVGNGAVIDSGSTVTKDIPSHEEWRGSPARFLRAREKYDALKALWEDQI